MFNNNGEVIDCTTSPFSFCAGILSFQSTDPIWEGDHEFTALGFTYTVFVPEVVEEEEEIREPKAAVKVIAETGAN